MEFIAGLSFLFLMGTALGLIGIGGSILTIPILAYVFKIPFMLSTTYSFFIVGVSSFFGFFKSIRDLALKKAAIFTIPSMTGVFIARTFIVPHIPCELGGIKCVLILKTLLITAMLCASYLMINNYIPSYSSTTQLSSATVKKISILSLFLGTFIGVLGISGGFLIIPALIIWLGLDIKQAVSTCLFVITLNSIIGFLSDQNDFSLIHYQHLLLFTTMALFGTFVGISIRSKVSAPYLKKVVGWIIMFVALGMAIKEFS